MPWVCKLTSYWQHLIQTQPCVHAWDKFIELLLCLFGFLFWFIICLILVYFNDIYFFVMVAVISGNYALFCELVYFCRGWQRSNARELLCTRHTSRASFVYTIGGLACLALWLYAHSRLCTRQMCRSYLRNFFVPLSHSTKEVMCPQQHITSYI